MRKNVKGNLPAQTNFPWSVLLLASCMILSGASAATPIPTPTPTCSPIGLSITLDQFPKTSSGGEAIVTMGTYSMPSNAVYNTTQKSCDYLSIAKGLTGTLKITPIPTNGAACPAEVKVAAKLDNPAYPTKVIVPAVLSSSTVSIPLKGKFCYYTFKAAAIIASIPKSTPATAPTPVVSSTPVVTPSSTPIFVLAPMPQISSPPPPVPTPIVAPNSSAMPSCASFNLAIIMDKFPQTSSGGEPIITMGTYLMPSTAVFNAAKNSCDYSSVPKGLAGTLKIIPIPANGAACPAEVTVAASLDGLTPAAKVVVPAILGSDSVNTVLGGKFCYYVFKAAEFVASIPQLVSAAPSPTPTFTQATATAPTQDVFVPTEVSFEGLQQIYFKSRCSLPDYDHNQCMAYFKYLDALLAKNIVNPGCKTPAWVTDPKGLWQADPNITAEARSIVFMDPCNAKCNNEYPRNYITSPETPLCDFRGLVTWNNTSKLRPNDHVVLRRGNIQHLTFPGDMTSVPGSWIPVIPPNLGINGNPLAADAPPQRDL